MNFKIALLEWLSGSEKEAGWSDALIVFAILVFVILSKLVA